VELVTTGAASKSTLASGASVLLVDDEEHLREAVRLVLEARGYGVKECSDAQEALELLQAGEQPDLILLDLMMPRMNGWQLRVELKHNPGWSKIPVIALSADRSAQALAIDADCHLAKPVDHQQLLANVERVLAKARAGDRASDEVRTLGKLAGEIVRNLEQPISYTLANLQLAQDKAEELEARLHGADAFSLIGIRQLLTRAQRGAERIAGLSQGTATFAALTGRPVTRPRVLVVDSDQGQLERMRCWLQDDYEMTTANDTSTALGQIDAQRPFDALLIALYGPTYEGMSLYEQLLEKAPAQADRVVFLTGGRFDDRMRLFLAAVRRPQLRRPIQPAELRQVLKQRRAQFH